MTIWNSLVTFFFCSSLCFWKPIFMSFISVFLVLYLWCFHGWFDELSAYGQAILYLWKKSSKDLFFLKLSLLSIHTSSSLSLIFSPQTRLSWISFEDVTARFPLVYQCASHSNRFSQCWASLSLRPVSLQQRKTLWAVWPSAAADTCCFFPQISWLAQSTRGINNMKLLSLSTTGMWIEKIWLNFYGKGIKLSHSKNSQMQYLNYSKVLW